MTAAAETKRAPERTRPQVLDQTKREVVVALLRAGWTREMAAAYVRCPVERIEREAKRNSRFASQMIRAEIEHRQEGRRGNQCGVRSAASSQRSAGLVPAVEVAQEHCGVTKECGRQKAKGIRQVAQLALRQSVITRSVSDGCASQQGAQRPSILMRSVSEGLRTRRADPSLTLRVVIRLTSRRRSAGRRRRCSRR